MKACIFVALFVSILPAAAQEATRQGPLRIAHVLRAETHRSHPAMPVYNASTGRYSYGAGDSVERETDLQIRDVIYEGPEIHKEAHVSNGCPATIENDKHGNAKQLVLAVGDKTYGYKITGIREAPAK